MKTTKFHIFAVVMLSLLCLTGCASISSAWDSTTSSISDFFKSDKPVEEKK